VSRGALLKNYYGIGHDSLDNYIAEISGQAPNVQTGQDCEYFSKFLQFSGENFDKWTRDGQLSGDGCVYPEVRAEHRLSAERARPELEVLQPADGQRPGPGRHHGHRARPGRPPAYRQDGLIFITFDESGDDANAKACCGEKDSLGYTDPSHPNVNEPGLYGPGGGRVGAVALPPFIKPGTRTSVDYNHYSLLKTMEKIFGLPLLGDARQPQVKGFGSGVFTG
jgi:hypothetical protein